MKNLLLWGINAACLLGVSYLIPGIEVRSLWTGLLVALVLGLLNLLVRPVLILLTLPVTLLSLGLALLGINALLFWFAAWLTPGFEVHGWWAALGGATLYSLLVWLAQRLLGVSKKAD